MDTDTIMEHKPTSLHTLVLSGGGMRGYSYLGCWRALEEFGLDYRFKTISGCSIGAIMGLLFSVGYSSQELEARLSQLSYSQVKDIQLLAITQNFGFESGLKFLAFVAELVQARLGDGLVAESLTFKQHYDRFGVKLVVNATNLNQNSVAYFSLDQSPEMPVLTAVKMSYSVPFLIAPVKWQDQVYVDGAVLDNTPVKPCLEQARYTLVLRLEQNLSSPQSITSFEDYCVASWATIYNQLVRLRHSEEQLDSFKHQVTILTKSIGSFNFMAGAEIRQDLFDQGYQACYDWLKVNKPQLVEVPTPLEVPTSGSHQAVTDHTVG